MMLELCVWGPAFGLPSIDPQCLAAIAYLTCALDTTQWILIIDHEPVSGSSGTYPLLIDGSNRISGYSSICSFLNSQGYSADSRQTPIQRANSAALTAHIEYTLQPLLDTFLYTTAINYPAIRHSWTKILPFYANYIQPPSRHAAALSRTVPLGLSEPPPQLSDAPIGPDSGPLPPAYDSSPSLIFRRKQTVIEQLKRSQAEARFRIESLLDDAIGPLAARLKRSKLLVTDEAPCSIDCLAFGFLTLLTKAKVEDRFIPDSLACKFPNVIQYVQRLESEILGPENACYVDRMLEEQSASISSTSTFRWRKATGKSYVASISTALKETIGAVISPSLAHYISEQFTGKSNLGGKVSVRRRVLAFPILPAIMMPFLAAMGFAGYVFAKSISNPTELVFGRERPRLVSLGAAGAALSVLRGPSIAGDSVQRDWVQQGNEFEASSSDGAIFAQVDIESNPRAS